MFFLKLLNVKQLKKYNNRYFLGFLGIIKGTKKYLKYKRWKTDKYNLYVAYFVIYRVTGKKPSLKYYRNIIASFNNIVK